MKETLKDIEQLTAGLYPRQTAEQTAKELFELDAVACQFNTISPDDKLLASIKADIAAQLSAQQKRSGLWVRVFASAACIAVAYAAGLWLLSARQTAPSAVAPSHAVAVKTQAAPVVMVWDDDNDQIEELYTSLENIQSSLRNENEQIYELEFCVNDIQSQINDLSEVFWKG